MRQLDFVLLCNEHMIDPALALENAAIREALKERNDDRVKELLKTEF